MLKHIVAVVGITLLAGPVFAADAPPASDTSASAPAKSSSGKKHHRKHHKAPASNSGNSAHK